MSPTTHALVGAALGRLAKRTDRAFLAGVASHALLDGLPHRGGHGAGGVAGGAVERDGHLLELTGAGAVVQAPAGHRAAGADATVCARRWPTGGVLPDLENISESSPGRHTRIFPSHWAPHRRHRWGLALGMELLVVAAALLGLSALGSIGSIPPSQRAADVIK